MKNYFETKKAQYFVEQKEDGTLFITSNGTDSIWNAGQVIASMGGIQAVLDRCTETITLEEFKARLRAKAESVEAGRKASALAEEQRRRQECTEALMDYDALIQTGTPIPANIDSIRVILRYLNTQNWGGWKLPALTIGYACNQYDCDGKTATTMILDEPIMIDGEKVSKLVYGAPRGHLTKYYSVR